MEECAEHFLCLSERKQDLTRIVLRESVALVMVRRAWHSVWPFITVEEVSWCGLFFYPMCPKSHLFSYSQEPLSWNTSREYV